MNKAVPHVCPVCKYRPESYYGLLVWVEDPARPDPLPLCPNHKEGYGHQLEPVTQSQPQNSTN